MINNKKNLHLSLKNSIRAETEKIDSKFAHIHDKFSKAEAVLGKDKEKSIIKTQKVVKDCFTIPQDEFITISECQSRLLALRKTFNKSEIVRMGLRTLSLMDDDHLLKLSHQITKVKTGKPKKY